jgi:hypothetical protein
MKIESTCAMLYHLWHVWLSYIFQYLVNVMIFWITVFNTTSVFHFLYYFYRQDKKISQKHNYENIFI